MPDGRAPRERTDPVDLSYSRRETPGEVWRNRVGVTGTLFAVAMITSYLLGRQR